MRVQLVQRAHGRETVAAVVSERSRRVLFACVGPDAGGALLAAVSWCRDQKYTVVSAPITDSANTPEPWVDRKANSAA